MTDEIQIPKRPTLRQANELELPRYYSSTICPRHPELDGERRTKRHICVGCHREKALARYHRKRARGWTRRKVECRA